MSEGSAGACVEGGRAAFLCRCAALRHVWKGDEQRSRAAPQPDAAVWADALSLPNSQQIQNAPALLRGGRSAQPACTNCPRRPRPRAPRAALDETQDAIRGLERDIQSVKGQMAELKTVLYAKFGNSVSGGLGGDGGGVRLGAVAVGWGSQ